MVRRDNDPDRRHPELSLPDTTGGGGGAGVPATTVTDERPWGITPAVGVATTYAREDHTHGTPNIGPATTVVTELVHGQAQAVGVSLNYAREDHTHGTPAAGGGTVPVTTSTVVSETSYGLTSSPGSPGSPPNYAIEDHTHGTPPLPTHIQLGLVIGTDVQAWAASLDTLSAATITAAGFALLDDADAAAQQTTLGLVPGTNVQAWDADLDTLAAATITAAGFALLDDADAATQRTTLGLGKLAQQASVDDSDWSGADLSVSNGGTGVSTLTAYAPLFGGTTGTGAVQSGTVGTSGQVLTSNGAGALPTFQAASGSDPWTVLTLASDETTTSTGYVTITGLDFTPDDSSTYIVEAYLLVASAAVTCGVQLGVSWPTAGITATSGAAHVSVPNNVSSTMLRNIYGGTPGMALSTAVPAVDNTYLGRVSAFFLTGVGVTGTFKVTLSSETGSTVAVKAGSVLMYRKV